MTASGVGAPIGGALIFAGTVIFAAGTIAYFFSNDSATEQGVKIKSLFFQPETKIIIQQMVLKGGTT